MRLAISTCCLLLWIGCSTPSTRWPEMKGAAANSGLSGMASSALERFRESFDSGKCELIYAEASEPFHELEPKSMWLNECNQLRFDLGSWKSVSVRTADTWQSFMAHVGGVALFETGSYSLWTTWRFENGRAKLFAFVLYGPSKAVVVPGRPLAAPRTPKLMDPPQLVPRRSDARSSG